MKSLAASELIINPDGSIYHLNLRPEQIPQTVITVGDPDRVAAVSKHFDRVDEKVSKREFVTHIGELNGQRLMVISTGIGTDNIDIVLNELDALVNIDFNTRQLKAEKTALDIIRIGTSGAMQESLSVDQFVFSQYSIGLDGLLLFYDYVNNANETMVMYEFMQQIAPKVTFPIRPYIAEASNELLEKIAKNHLKGITITCPGFYAPQGRQLRAIPSVEQLLDYLPTYSYRDIQITNFEMETAGIYGLSNVLGHRALSCNAILANRVTGEFSQSPGEIVEKLIVEVLERLV